MKVCKFGGTSLASAEQIKKVCDIIISDSDRKIMVVSAPGKRVDSDTKVTDLLIACANKFIKDKECSNELKAVVDRYADIACGLGLSNQIVRDIENNLLTRLSMDYDNPDKLMDSMKASGEDNSAKIIASYLKSLGKNAHYVNPKDAGLFLSDEYGNARVLPQSMKNLKKLCDYEGIIVFPGFFGYSLAGDVVTFPRGGSDITGSILAAALEVDVYENFTDVDSVYVANPRLIENPKPISILTYREMRELAYAGFSVLHEETLEPVYHKGIPVNIKNTNNPSAPGTWISTTRDISDFPVSGVAGEKGFCCININKYMMNREIGFGRKVLWILEEESVPFEHMPSGIDDISILIKNKYLDTEKKNRIMERIAKELKVDSITIEYGIALVMIVGEGMLHSVGVASRATKALSDNNINIRIINQGSSEVSIMFGIHESHVDKAVVALYNEFFKK